LAAYKMLDKDNNVLWSRRNFIRFPGLTSSSFGVLHGEGCEAWLA